MAVAFGPTFCSSVLVLKSELLHSPEAQYGFCSKNTAIMVAKTSPFGLKNRDLPPPLRGRGASKSPLGEI